MAGKPNYYTAARKREGAERAEKMAEWFRAGKTLHEIGCMHGVTRQRVQQILKKIGITAEHGGVHAKCEARKASKRKASEARRSAKSLISFGCDYPTLRKLNDGKCARYGLACAYRRQKHAAEQRGIEWQFTFPAWVAVWKRSGRLNQRGRSAESFVMARFGDSGPYSPSNVYITTLRQNTSDYQALRNGRVPSYLKAA